jgi:hypothetical protein
MNDRESSKPLRLYWCWTDDHRHDWFMVARTAEEAQHSYERQEGYDIGEVRAELVATLPAHVQDGTVAGYGSEDVVMACGGVMEHPMPTVIRFDERRYVEGWTEHLHSDTRH